MSLTEGEAGNKGRKSKPKRCLGSPLARNLMKNARGKFFGIRINNGLTQLLHSEFPRAKNNSFRWHRQRACKIRAKSAWLQNRKTGCTKSAARPCG
jgi:hypothetical protein